MTGAELGYRYAGSPIIADEPGGPEDDFRQYVPSAWPGARLPHVWLEDRTPVQDRIGRGFTLLRLRDHDTAALEKAMRGVPFDVVDFRDDHARELYGCDLILLRPDLHVAWRGNSAPADAARLAALVTGH